MAHGINQPVMIGKLHVSAVAAPDLAAIDDGLTRLTGEATPQPPTADPRLALAQRVLFWSAAAQRLFNLPTVQSGHAWMPETDDGAMMVHVALPYVLPAATKASLVWACRGVSAQLRNGTQPLPNPQEVQHDLLRLGDLLKSFAIYGMNTTRFLMAAQTLGIPARPVVSNVFSYGQGRHSRWLESSYTDHTPVVSARIARDKLATAQLLRQAGLPAPRSALATTPQQAVAIAHQLGFPVVVKPADRDQGLGVAADLRDDAAVLAAYDDAARHSTRILVEKHVQGVDYRLTVFNGRVIKTIVRRPGGVMGDGRLTVAELVEQVNARPREFHRGMSFHRTTLQLDPQAQGMLARQALTPEFVPAEGQFVALRGTASVSAGGTPLLVTQPAHPDNLLLATRAAAALRLDLAGIDLIMADITRSWLDIGALICEVNGQPQIGHSLTPTLYAQVLRELVGEPFRIPVVLLIGDDADLADQITKADAAGRVWGQSSGRGVWIDQQRIANAQSHTFVAAHMLVCDATIDAALVVMTPAQILLHGLPYDRINVVVLVGPSDGAAWSDFEAGEMWSMALPHITQAIVHLPASATWLPDPTRLPPGHGPALLYVDNKQDIAGTVHAQLVASHQSPPPAA